MQKFMSINKDNLIGELTEIEVLLCARKLGIDVSIPFGNNFRYDQIWDVNGKLYKIQIKHANMASDGSGFHVSGKSSTGKYDSTEIDAIVTSLNGIIYYIPSNEIGQGGKTLRLHHTPNTISQPQIRWAYDYVLERKLEGLII